jgi:hypothetical protein
MDVNKISFCPTNQSSVALYHILDDASVKLTLFQPPTVVINQLISQSTLWQKWLIMNFEASIAEKGSVVR